MKPTKFSVLFLDFLDRGAGGKFQVVVVVTRGIWFDHFGSNFFQWVGSEQPER